MGYVVSRHIYAGAYIYACAYGGQRSRSGVSLSSLNLEFTDRLDYLELVSRIHLFLPHTPALGSKANTATICSLCDMNS